VVSKGHIEWMQYPSLPLQTGSKVEVEQDDVEVMVKVRSQVVTSLMYVVNTKLPLIMALPAA